MSTVEGGSTLPGLIFGLYTVPFSSTNFLKVKTLLFEAFNSYYIFLIDWLFR
jgi:hypothetical protein